MAKRHPRKRVGKPKAAKPAKTRRLTPRQLLSATPGPVRCFINRHWRDHRQASVMCLKSVPGSGHIMAQFLVDLGVAGLKDTWGQLDMSPEAFADEILGTMSMTDEIAPIDAAAAMKLVAGAARWAKQNRFRLPHDWEQWAALIGDVGDWEQEADVSEFALEYGGTREDLRQRLIGTTVEQFLARPDIEFILGDEDDDFSLLSDDQRDFEQEIDHLAEAAVSKVRTWCFATRRAPHPMLADAVKVMLMASQQAMAEMSDEEILNEAMSDPAEPDAAEADHLTSYLARAIAALPPAEAEGLRAATRQFQEYAVENPDALLSLMPPLDDEE